MSAPRTVAVVRADLCHAARRRSVDDALVGTVEGLMVNETRPARSRSGAHRHRAAGHVGRRAAVRAELGAQSQRTATPPLRVRVLMVTWVFPAGYSLPILLVSLATRNAAWPVLVPQSSQVTSRTSGLMLRLTRGPAALGRHPPGVTLGETVEGMLARVRPPSLRRRIAGASALRADEVLMVPVVDGCAPSGARRGSAATSLEPAIVRPLASKTHERPCSCGSMKPEPGWCRRR